ncbi:hypothetical protein DH2020_011844 [Rehmannia glutinosa]|uniref:EamA domain-containing protein n=1 Tax=Rehmannia glutinosa TaxID=99300 RepID=A0ABR0XEM9_REHGL
MFISMKDSVCLSSSAAEKIGYGGGPRWSPARKARFFNGRASSSSDLMRNYDEEKRLFSSKGMPVSQGQHAFSRATKHILITHFIDSENNEVLRSSSASSVFNGKRLTFKSLFGKRALWRRIFFASQKVRSIILLNVITIIYASNIPVVKEVEAIIDPEAFTVVRFAVAAIPFLPFVFQARDDTHTRNAGIELGFWVSLGYILQALGLLTSDAGRASFLCMFTVIVVPLIDGMLGSAIPPRTWFGALMSIIGVAMLESSGSPPCVCVVALLSTAWYIIQHRFVGGIQESNAFSWTWAAVLDSISSFPWIPALYTGIFSTGLCLWVEMAAMRDVSATETAIIYGLEPVWGAGFAWVLLGERWGVSGWIGAALVLGGSLTVQIMGARDCTSREAESIELMVSDKKNSFSASPVVVNSIKDSSDLIKK